MHKLARLIVVLALAALLPARSASAQEICFNDLPICFGESFAGYWEENGGLPVFGYPLTISRLERNRNLAIYVQTQWTERTRLERHLENPAPYDILLGHMGSERLAQLGRTPALEGRESGPLEGCLWFAETGHNVCDQAPGLVGFRSYWEGHGLKVPGLDAYQQSLMLFGYPLTAPAMELNGSGDYVLTQWFERARFEWHPANQDQYKVLLGLLGSETLSGDAQAPRSSMLGVQFDRSLSQTIDKARAAGVDWVRYDNSLLWDKVEPEKGERRWSSSFEDQLKQIGQAGMIPVVVVKNTPFWAQRSPGLSCGPIKEQELDSFAAFMRDAVARYSAPPYNVQYWEIWNEPDAYFGPGPATSVYGCWGDKDDPYYGGGYYAEMLKHIYPAIKAANPQAQVLLGGLLLDCDPTRTYTAPPKDCSAGRFMEGVLRNGGGAFFDMLTYHAYSYWYPNIADSDLLHPFWSHRGGALLGKLDFLRTLLAKYGVSKPIVMNEGALLCYRSSASCKVDAFYRATAHMVIRSYVRGWANSLHSLVWYTFDGPGWQESGLLDSAQQPRPGYWAMMLLNTLLEDAQYLGPRSNGPVEGYAFQRSDGSRFEFYWTNDLSTVVLPLPATTVALYNSVGERSIPQEATVQVGTEPIVIEIGR